MERLSPGGILIEDLLITLKNRRAVMLARKADACLLCKNPRVNEAGLCDPCYSALDDDELSLATRWLAGFGP